MVGEQLRIWPEVLRLFALAEVLIEEIERSESFVNFHDSFAYWHIFETAAKEEKKLLQSGEADKLRHLNIKYSCTLILQSHLDTNNEKLLNQIHQIESEGLKQEINLICEPFLKCQTA
jgi:hypothetical protein